MESRAKQRLTGAIILVALFVLLVPELLRGPSDRSEEHTSELQSLRHLVCRLLLPPRSPDLHSFPTRRSSDLPPRGPVNACWYSARSSRSGRRSNSLGYSSRHGIPSQATPDRRDHPGRAVRVAGAGIAQGAQR